MAVLEMDRPPVIPDFCESVADLWRDADGLSVGVGRVRSTAIWRVAEHLLACRIPYFMPVERVIRRYDGHRKEWDRAIFPGCIFVGDGDSGREALMEYGVQYSGTVHGYLIARGRVQMDLRQSLTELEPMARAGVLLASRDGLQPGHRAEVIAGPFRGSIGKIISRTEKFEFVMELPTLGRDVPTTIPQEMVEPLD